MSDYYISPKAAFDATADAIRAKTGSQAGIEWTADGFADAIDDIPTGGGTAEAEWNDVCFWDYDGSCLYSYSASEFANLSALPANPTHNGLTAQGWNWSLSDAKTHAATYGMLDIGQLYTTSDGKTRLYITVKDPLRMSRFLNLKCSVANALTLDWGDNSQTETNTNTSNATYSHTYATLGDYVITLSVSSGTLTLRERVMHGSSYAQWSANSLEKVEIGENVVLQNNVFNEHFCLEEITMPTSVSYGTGDSLFNKTGLVAAIFPKAYGLTSAASIQEARVQAVCLPNQTEIYSSWSNLTAITLKRLCVPVRFNGNQGMANACSIERFFISPNTTQLYPQGIFASSIIKLIIPASVTSIASAWNTATYCYSLKEVHMLGETPPTAGSSSIFSYAPSDMIIYVPYSADHSILEAYQTATNWSTYASQMQEEP